MIFFFIILMGKLNSQAQIQSYKDNSRKSAVVRDLRIVKELFGYKKRTL